MVIASDAALPQNLARDPLSKAGRAAPHLGYRNQMKKRTHNGFVSQNWPSVAVRLVKPAYPIVPWDVASALAANRPALPIFEDVTEHARTAPRGVALRGFNNHGFIGIAIQLQWHPAVLLKNATSHNRWLIVQAVGSVSNGHRRESARGNCKRAEQTKQR